MMTGTDGGSMMAPSLTLRQEFADLAKAGLSPLKILQMTIVNPAEYLGRQDHHGHGRAGAPCGLGGAGRQPARQCGEPAAVNAVVRAAKHYSAAELAALKARVASTGGRV
jgi:hypothetical protein